MHKYLTEPDSSKDELPINFQKCLTFGNYLMITALSVVLASICVSYIFNDHFGLTSQVLAHISTLIFAGVVKVGYIIRCVGAKGLGHRNF